ncbi:MAG: diol dehydratase small subunit [Actinomycetota bacterium]|nr:diol dehydratase small subunit [Actinomycetota bacterium]
MSLDPRSEYPLGAHRVHLLRTPSGVPLEEVTLDALRAGRLQPADVRATPDTLVRQAEIARASGRPQLAENLARAAELASVPSDELLAVYTALRPHRSTAGELDDWAERLEAAYDAPLCAALVREARQVYAERGLLRSGDRAAV